MNQPTVNPIANLNLNLYGEIAIEVAPRIIGFQDRDERSRAYGCFDRMYWEYGVMDFTNGRFQEASLFLALLYTYNHPNNPFYQKEKLLRWTGAGISFWNQIQRRDGSFDEYWPFERSFVTTCFSLYAIAESCRLLLLEPPKKAIEKAARWVDQHENFLVLNQMAGAVMALATAGLVLQDSKWIEKAECKLKSLLERQDPEGFFEEYGGYDIGYLTINLSYLAKFYLLAQQAEASQTQNDGNMEHVPPLSRGARGDSGCGINPETIQHLRNALNKAFQFLDTKVEQNGTYNYQETSRHTQYIYPYSFRAMQQWDLFERHNRGLQEDAVLNPTWMDDRFCIPLSIDYLQTAHLDDVPAK